MLSSLYLMLTVASAHSDYDQPTPIYTVLPNGEKLEILFDFKSYIVASVIGIPIFLLLIGTHFYLRNKYDLYVEKQKKPVHRVLSNTQMALYSVDTPTSPKRHRVYEP